jgi:hypothetical protein
MVEIKESPLKMGLLILETKKGIPQVVEWD